MDFDFNKEQIAQNVLSLDDIGNVCIEASNDEGFFYYMIISTEMGETRISTFGPIIPDVEILFKSYSFESYSLDYKEAKIQKAIKIWLNDPKKLTDAKIIEKDLAISMLPDLANLL